MVHPKAGSYGAVAQNARKKSKDSTNGKQHQNKYPMPAKIAKKGKGKSHEKAQTAQEIRNQNEYALLEKELLKGGDLGELNIAKLEKALDNMQQDEKSGEIYSDEEDEEEKKVPELKPEVKPEVNKKKQKPIQEEPITDLKLLQRYRVDREDYLLQFAKANEEPLYLGPYQTEHYPCFYAAKFGMPTVNTTTLNQRLLQYSNEIMSKHVPYKPVNFPIMLIKSDKFRHTAPHPNICFNPLQALRAWGLLSNIAQNKTLDDLIKFINYYLKSSFETSQQVNEELLAIYCHAERIFEGCVRLFTEIPFHLPYHDDTRNVCSTYYGGKSKRSAIQHHCFGTDPDGFYSCHRINEEVAVSTHGSIRYVIPESSAPNWRASVALVSAVNSTFYWKTDDFGMPVVFPMGKFICPRYGISACTATLAKAEVRYKENIYRLDGYDDNVHLYIIMEPEKDVDKSKSIDLSILKKISDSSSWPLSSQKKVFVPRCTTSLPLSLSDHSESKGLKRLYCSEKSELRKLKKGSLESSGSPQFETLYDHYHKSLFEIVAARPSQTDEPKKFDLMGPGKAHQCVDESSSFLFAKFQNEEKNVQDAIYTYFEEHLPANPQQYNKEIGENQYVVVDADTLNLCHPFYYLLTRPLIDGPCIVCTGYFNNTTWVMQ